MAKRVVIVGDVTGRPARKSVLDALKARRADVTWEWLQAVGPGFNVPPKYFGSLLHELRQKNDTGPPKPIVVKLEHLHGKDANELLRVCPDPVRAPLGLDTLEQLIEWLLSDDASLFHEPPWRASLRQAALISVLAKLIKNKSWNKDKQGHQWTKEADLLGQAPVVRSDLPKIYEEATVIVEMAKTSLLITKGGKQGKTPKEWCIHTAFLPAVKRAITTRSLEPLRTEIGLQGLMQHVDSGVEALDTIEIDESIVSEKVISVCRERLTFGR